LTAACQSEAKKHKAETGIQTAATGIEDVKLENWNKYKNRNQNRN
jgi:hypothetical protein